MDFSTDDKHRATLEMLRETLGYLERLPPVPVTRSFCAKLRAHLEEPAHRLVEQSRRELFGRGPFTAAGLPLLEASVVGDVLRIKLPEQLTAANRKLALAEIAKLLQADELALQLEARNSVPPG